MHHIYLVSPPFYLCVAWSDESRYSFLGTVVSSEHPFIVVARQHYDAIPRVVWACIKSSGYFARLLHHRDITVGLLLVIWIIRADTSNEL
jgi:hypothetical protein